MRIRSTLLLVCSGFALTLVFIVSGCTTTSNNTKSASNQLNVVVSMPPLSSIALNVAGDVATVENLLPTGASPHLYSLKPSDVELLSNADLYIETGLGIEEFLDDAHETSGNTELTILELESYVVLVESSDIHEEENEAEVNGEAEQLTIDSHIWLSIQNAIAITKAIAESMSELDPDNAAIYATNANNYIQQLEELDAYADKKMGTITHKEFIPLHPAWTYFAHDYELEQVTAIELIPGQEPSAQDMATLLEEIEEYDIQALFAEPQLESRIVNSLAYDTGLPVYTIDPEGTSSELSKTLYEDIMRTNIDTFANALK